jgi:hypothetical protein
MKQFSKVMHYKIIFLFLILIATTAFAANPHLITSKYQLDIGQYLLPANKKVHLKNWYHPDIEDYKILQNYLTFSPRPELRYLNYPGTEWREKRMRDFRLIVEGETPKFEILYLNNNPSGKKNCIVTYISFNDRYVKNLNSLIEQLKNIGFDGHFIFRIGGWPYTEEGSLEFFDVPYAFKIFSILEAKKLGYENCLWLDACFLPLKKLDPIFEHIAEHGVFFVSDLNYSMKNHIQEFATEAFDMSLSDFLQKITTVSSFCVGLDLTSKRGANLLDSWHEMVKDKKLGFLSFIPEMAALCILIDKFELLPYTANMNYFAFITRESITQETILFWNHYWTTD